jgi:hypothetical protein
MIRWARVRRAISAQEITRQIGTRAQACEPTETLRGVDLAVADAESGQPLMAIAPIPARLLGELHELLPAMDVTTTLRAASGYRNASRVFGWAPRKPMFKHESCHPTPFMRDEPALARVLCDLADHAGGWLLEELPAVARRNAVGVAAIHNDWRITPGPGRMWTSGVINRNSALPYHRDGNNFPTWSVQACIRSNVAGGFLRLPEYDLTVPCADGTLIYFWGQRYVHGVTPLRPIPRTEAYRFTIVYYALRGMKDCASYAIEQAGGRARRAERETRIATVGVNYGKRSKPTRKVAIRDT